MIYLDNHATTPCDARVAERMMPWLVEKFGNPHSTAHEFGREAASAIDAAIEVIASRLGVASDAVLITSGATESNNLAIDGVCRHPRQKKRHLITTTIEHPAVLDVARRLETDGFRVTRVPVHELDHERAGQIILDQLASALDDDTALVSVHWANNEIGVIQPMEEIASMVHESGALLHSDATQAVGRINVDLQRVDVDLISATAHKFYGPKGVGLLTIGGGVAARRVRLKPMIIGGGQQRGLRSGTQSPANVVALATALELAVGELADTSRRVHQMRKRLWDGLCDGILGMQINGPSLESAIRLPGNLNCRLPAVEGQAWMAACPQVAFSSGSACSSVEAKPSHVLTGLGLEEAQARRSVRFGIGKFNTADEMDRAVESLVAAYIALT
jgi:cysteine desulfurase